MPAKGSDLVVISRDTRGETVNSKPRPARVYVTGPHFSEDTYSSKNTKREAIENDGLFPREEARRLIAQGHWRHHDPVIEPA